MNRQELQDYLKALYAIRKTGARRVTHGGKTVEFHSLSEIALEIASTQAALDRLSGTRRRTMHCKRMV